MGPRRAGPLLICRRRGALPPPVGLARAGARSPAEARAVVAATGLARPRIGSATCAAAPATTPTLPAPAGLAVPALGPYGPRRVGPRGRSGSGPPPSRGRARAAGWS